MALNRSTIVFSFAAALLFSAAALLTWQWYESRYPTWNEEVLLSDGRVITVTQKHEYYDNYGTNQSWVTIDLPELGGKREWHSYLVPQRVDVYEGKVYVFGYPRGDRQYVHYRYPTNYMVGFLWNGNEFSRIPFLQVPEAIRQEENIYSCVPNHRTKLTVAIKDTKWCEPRGAKKQYIKKIDIAAYQALSVFTADLHGAKPISE